MRSIIFLNVGNHQDNKLNDYPNINLGCRFPLGERWLPALKSVVSSVINVDLRDSYLKLGPKKMAQSVIEKLYRYRPKYLIWTADSDLEMSEAILIQAEALKVTRIGIFFDDLNMFDYYPRYWLPYLDYAVTVDSFQSLKKYAVAGVKAYFMPCCPSGQIYNRKNLPFKYQVSFVGTSYGPRRQLIEVLAGLGIRVDTFGLGWDKKDYIKTSEMVNIYNASKINLNFTNDRRQLRARMFEVCLSGGFLLTQNAVGLGKLFKIGREIEVFNTITELAAKIKYYLRHERARAKIARAGYLRVKQDYTLEIKLKQLFQAIESGKLPKIKLSNLPMNHLMIKKRKLRLALQRWALALAKQGYSLTPRSWSKIVWWQNIIKKIIY